MSNRLCEILGIRYPIVQGAMHLLALPELAAAVSEAEGLGTVAAAIYPDKEHLIEAIRHTRSLTAKPFAVNISLLAELAGKEKLDGYMEAVLQEKPPVVETSGRSPEEYLHRLRAAGIRTIHKVPSVRFARKAEDLGVDVITVVGFECGGHPGGGDGTAMVQIAKAARELSTPLIAGGGIADGAGMAAALCLGADGVIMGTRFFASTECTVHPAFKEALCAATEEDTVLVQKSIKIPLRVWRNATANKVLQMEAKGATMEDIFSVISGPLTGKAYLSGDVESCAFPMGQCAGLISEVKPVAVIIKETVEDAARILNKTCSSLA